MNPALRRVALTAHVVSSVGWIGAVAAYLALAIVGLITTADLTERAAYAGMQLTGWFAVAPFCAASFMTGLVQSIGTPWGLIRHYWVLIKLLITAFSSLVLLIHLGATDRLAAAASGAAALSGDEGARIQMTYAAALAIAALLLMTVLSIYKPQGLTPRGWRNRPGQRTHARN